MSESRPNEYPHLEAVIDTAVARRYDYEILDDRTVLVMGSFGDSVIAGLDVMADAPGDVAVITAPMSGGARAICLWRSPHLYCIKLGEQPTWEHFDCPRGLHAVRDSWRNGTRSRYRVSHGPLIRPIPEAVELAEEFGIEIEERYLRPQPTRTVTRTVPASRTASSRPAASRPTSRPASARGSAAEAVSAAASGGAPAKAEPVVGEPAPKVCPTCFMVLPLSGRCDSCG